VGGTLAASDRRYRTERARESATAGAARPAIQSP
jgi:hypothetical protein